MSHKCVVDSSGAVTEVLTVRMGAKVIITADHVTVAPSMLLRSEDVASSGKAAEDVTVPATWEFHDLLFHAKVRTGRVRRKPGGTARFGVAPNFPTTMNDEPRPGDIALPPVDIPSLVRGDRPFGEVMRSRVSHRDWIGSEVELQQLSELLSRVCEPIERIDKLADGEFERIGYPYPTGGGLYETDLVVIANRVSELESGAYLYRPASHSLTPLRGSSDRVQTLLHAAGEAVGSAAATPQLLLICAARFPDLAVKYEGIAYALMVKHVGVIMATVGFTATAMGLGSVPIGTGDSDCFAAATGLDYYRHGSIGEMAISTMLPTQ